MGQASGQPRTQAGHLASEPCGWTLRKILKEDLDKGWNPRQAPGRSGTPDMWAPRLLKGLLGHGDPEVA